MENEELIEEKEVIQDDVNEIENRAKNMGWVPKEEFRGDPSYWKTAEDFIKHGEETLPILRERIRKMDANFTAELEKNRKVIKEFSEHYKSVAQRSYEKAIRDLKREQLETVEAGDTDGYLKIEKDIEAIEKERPVVNEEQQTPDGFDEWNRDHPWYGMDVELTAYADSMGNFLLRTKPGLRGKDFFNELTKQVESKYPERFENPNRRIVATVDSGNPGVAQTRSKNDKTYANLPPEAKAQCDAFVNEGLLTKEQYIKDYEWE